ncbi:MAG: hypothetical protein V1824_04145 [archaeon]
MKINKICKIDDKGRITVPKKVLVYNSKLLNTTTNKLFLNFDLINNSLLIAFDKLVHHQ